MAESKKSLYRPVKNRVIGGVCLAFANYFSVDVVLIRILALITVFTGSGVMLYLVLWALIPSESLKTSSFASSEVFKANSKEIEDWITKWFKVVQENSKDGRKVRLFWGIVIIAIGIGLLMQNLGYLAWFNADRFWPLILIMIGLIFILKKDER